MGSYNWRKRSNLTSEDIYWYVKTSWKALQRKNHCKYTKVCTFGKSSGLASQLSNCIGDKKNGGPLGSSWHLGNIPGIRSNRIVYKIESSGKRKCVSRINHPRKLRLHCSRMSCMSSQRQIGKSWNVKMVGSTITLWTQDSLFLRLLVALKPTNRYWTAREIDMLPSFWRPYSVIARW